ncbi:hypothetical protein AB0861_019380, partial [Acinetobacter baumannii]
GKLNALSAGAEIVRRELTGYDLTA